jgi:hypothetical protein
MKRLTIILLLSLSQSSNLSAQSANHYGGWFFKQIDNRDILPKTHQSQSAVFPPTYIGSLDNGVKVNLSPKEKTKLTKIVDALKEVYPKPYLHSYLYWVQPKGSNKLTQNDIDKRAYRFGYALNVGYVGMEVADNQVLPQLIVPTSMEQTINMTFQWSMLTVNVNTIPNFLGGDKPMWFHAYDGPTLEVEDDFTYRKTKEGSKELKSARDKNLGYVLSITSRNETISDAKNILGNSIEIPTINFGNNGDKYVIFRKFSSSRIRYDGQFVNHGKHENSADRYKEDQMHTMVIMSHNDKLPLLPLTIKQYLDIAEQLVDDNITNQKNYRIYYPDEYQRNKKHYDDLETKALTKEEKNRAFINQLRVAYQDRLLQQAVVSLPYAHLWQKGSVNVSDNQIFNQRTGKFEPISTNLIARFFAANPIEGKAYYSYDDEFYKNMSDGEIRTIAVCWTEKIRNSNHQDYQKGNSIKKDGVKIEGYSDNPDTYFSRFGKTFNWNQLSGLLGK